MSFVHFYPRDAAPDGLGAYAPGAQDALRALQSKIGSDLTFDRKHPYARLLIRTLSPQYGAHVFDILTATNWIAAYCPPIGDYELAAASPYASQPGSLFAHQFRVEGDAHIVQSADEALQAIYPAFEAWCELGEISVGSDK